MVTWTTGFFVPSARLLRLDERFVLFVIGVVFAPVRGLREYPEAAAQLSDALSAMDGDEISHFGGVAKHALLSDYVASVLDG